MMPSDEKVYMLKCLTYFFNGILKDNSYITLSLAIGNQSNLRCYEVYSVEISEIHLLILIVAMSACWKYEWFEFSEFWTMNTLNFYF